jgi:lipopolysaccharide export system permease protein
VFLTKKAVNDSAVFNPDVWVNALRRFMGLHQTRKLELKEVVINDVDTSHAVALADALKQQCEAFVARYPGRQGYLEYFQNGYDVERLKSLSLQMDELVDYLSNSRDQMVLGKAMDFPVIRQLPTYRPIRDSRLGKALAVLLPLSVPLYLVGIRHQRNLKRDIAAAATVCDQLTAILQGNYTRDKEYSV